MFRSRLICDIVMKCLFHLSIAQDTRKNDVWTQSVAQRWVLRAGTMMALDPNSKAVLTKGKSLYLPLFSLR